MNLLDAEEGKEYLISSVNTEDDEEMEDFLFFSRTLAKEKW